MKKYFLYTIVTFVVLAIIDLSQKLYKYYAPTRSMTPYHTASQDDDTIRIAYIGDSWAYIHQQHKQCQISHIIKMQTNCPTRVYSYGLGGRTSNEIYEAIFTDKTLGKLLREKGADYCFISAGINDVNKKLSTKYYKKSMDNIIRFMLINNIHPVILEIPDFDVHKAYRGLKESSKLLRKLSMTINSVPMDGKQMYRDELDALIKEKGYQKKVNIIRYKTWNNNYQNDQDKLYLSDGVHLNALGYAVLDSVIAKVILTKIKK